MINIFITLSPNIVATHVFLMPVPNNNPCQMPFSHILVSSYEESGERPHKAHIHILFVKYLLAQSSSFFMKDWSGSQSMWNWHMNIKPSKIHSKLHNIIFAATKVYAIFRSFVVSTWVCDKKISSMWHYGITQSQYCNTEHNYNEDNVMHVNIWFEFFGSLFHVN
jgi:hypothetical protein